MLEREAIYQRVWGYAMAHGDRSVDVFIRKLRQKLEKRSPGWRYIHTHFGVGYRFDPEPLGGAVAGAGRCRPPPERAGRPAIHKSFTTASRPRNRRPASAMLGGHGGETGHPRRDSTGASRSGPRSTPPWSTAAR